MLLKAGDPSNNCIRVTSLVKAIRTYILICRISSTIVFLMYCINRVITWPVLNADSFRSKLIQINIVRYLCPDVVYEVILGCWIMSHALQIAPWFIKLDLQVQKACSFADATIWYIIAKGRILISIWNYQEDKVILDTIWFEKYCNWEWRSVPFIYCYSQGRSSVTDKIHVNSVEILWHGP